MKSLKKATMSLFIVFAVTALSSAATFTVNPNVAQTGQKLSVLITGQDTHFKSGSPTTVTFYTQGSPTSQGSITTSWFINDLLMMVELNVPDDEPVGLHDISVQNSIDGTLMLYDAIDIEAYEPKITSVTPAGAYQGQSLSVTISGQNTNFSQGSLVQANCYWDNGWQCDLIFVPLTNMQGSTTINSVVWFTQGTSSIYSKTAMVHNPGYVTATFDIPVDANYGLWDVHIPDFMEETVLTYVDGFNILQPGDWTGDGAVNMLDMSIVAGYWLEGTEE